ncbi:MAG: LPXTG cell wall anchor domain-containing protein [Betaproteobacteria bacterium]|nr:LPXTG cell wall anchor domain-containing protein [Betaproteobacteria bacterium]
MSYTTMGDVAALQETVKQKKIEEAKARAKAQAEARARAAKGGTPAPGEDAKAPGDAAAPGKSAIVPVAIGLAALGGAAFFFLKKKG